MAMGYDSQSFCFRSNQTEKIALLSAWHDAIRTWLCLSKRLPKAFQIPNTQKTSHLFISSRKYVRVQVLHGLETWDFGLATRLSWQPAIDNFDSSSFSASTNKFIWEYDLCYMLIWFRLIDLQIDFWSDYCFPVPVNRKRKPTAK